MHDLFFYNYLNITFPSHSTFSEQFNFIYLGPKNGEDKSVGLLLIPHGGPHSNFANTFSLDYMFFALAGNKYINK